MANAIATFVPIIVIIIGALAPFLTGTIYNQFYNRPNINIMIKPSDNVKQFDNMTTSIEITNSGIVPATNLTLTIDANTRIKNITNDLSTSDIRLKNSTNTIDLDKTHNVTGESLQLTIPRLASGEGSIIRINSFIEYNDTYNYPDDYNVYATYDQGSAVGVFKEKSQEEEFVGTFSALSETVFLGNTYFLWTYYVIFYILFAFFYLRWANRERTKKYITNIMYEIISARSNLKEHRDSTDPLSNRWKGPWRGPQSPFEWILDKRYPMVQKVHVAKRQLNGTDYVRIDDFYKKLAERNSFVLQPVSDRYKLISLNDECFYLAEDALKNVDWKKYV